MNILRADQECEKVGEMKENKRSLYQIIGTPETVRTQILYYLRLPSFSSPSLLLLFSFSSPSLLLLFSFSSPCPLLRSSLAFVPPLSGCLLLYIFNHWQDWKPWSHVALVVGRPVSGAHCDFDLFQFFIQHLLAGGFEMIVGTCPPWRARLILPKNWFGAPSRFG